MAKTNPEAQAEVYDAKSGEHVATVRSGVRITPVPRLEQYIAQIRNEDIDPLRVKYVPPGQSGGKYLSGPVRAKYGPWDDVPTHEGIGINRTKKRRALQGRERQSAIAPLETARTLNRRIQLRFEELLLNARRRFQDFTETRRQENSAVEVRVTMSVQPSQLELQECVACLSNRKPGSEPKCDSCSDGVLHKLPTFEKDPLEVSWGLLRTAKASDF